jgi:transcriptional regulator GlxA family with amidase domain
MTNFPRFSPDRPRRVAILVFPGFQILDATGPLGAFEIASRHRPQVYTVETVAAVAGPVTSSSGLQVLASGLPDPDEVDTLVVAGGEGSRRARFEPRLRDYLVRAHRRARRVTSVCSGAYLLAEAGLLDGRRATTHWRVAEGFARAYPKVRVEPDRIHVRDGEVWTSAGVTAGIDLALALIAEDHGEALARATAQELVVFLRRPGGQSQYSALLDLAGSEGRFAELLAWARASLTSPLTVEALAERAKMSPRTFHRAFTAETGTTPAKAVERLRLEAARGLVEQSDRTIDAIAAETGFADPERMRRAFLRAFGQPPQGLRRAARTKAGGNRTFRPAPGALTGS